MNIIGAVRFTFKNGSHVVLYPAGKPVGSSVETWTVQGGLELLYREQLPGERFAPIEYTPSDLNVCPLRLKETVRYCCRLESGDGIIHIRNGQNKFVKIEADIDRITFQFINYLCKSYLYLGGDADGNRLHFEVVPNKIGYESDYVNLTEAIAEECAALLLDYASPTSLSFAQDEERNQKTALEQFIFLRQFCYGENLESLFAAIKRNPDRVLVNEAELKPLGAGVPSQSFFANPFANSRSWSDVGGGKFVPLEVAASHKYESYDTPANRFLKFALNRFLEICTVVLRSTEAAETVCHDEAADIKNHIEEMLDDVLFSEVGALIVMPAGNQVLEKREGYAQVFKAFSMVDLALQLDWRGKDDVYSGEAKNTALLYEYWLFFELRKIIAGIAGCTPIADKRNPSDDFVQDKDGLTLLLRQGEKSKQLFSFGSLTVALYYNRAFSPRVFKDTYYWGSYSRPFRPDYTVAVYPASYQAEQDAIRAGEVSYIHFDAKYRVEDMTRFFQQKEYADDTDESLSEEEAAQLQEEKQDAVVNTYKAGDLLKMHTYNDAIRRTIGSYVLYPGTAEKTCGSVYDEILPGVGAFAIRPSNAHAAHAELRDFVRGILLHQESRASRVHKLNQQENLIIRSPSEIAREYAASLADHTVRYQIRHVSRR